MALMSKHYHRLKRISDYRDIRGLVADVSAVETAGHKVQPFVFQQFANNDLRLMTRQLAVENLFTVIEDAKQYDRDRFQAQFEQLKARNIEFVVASGNQYYQLISFFPELKDQISFVAENGALV